jgi:hypothetical protein
VLAPIFRAILDKTCDNFVRLYGLQDWMKHVADLFISVNMLVKLRGLPYTRKNSTMDRNIVELMASPKRDVGWLQDALRSAVKLELSTIPPYLCGYWALRDAAPVPAADILNIAMQEMAHLGFACNMLCATGKQPAVLADYASITYPGGLPGGVEPKQDDELIPWDPAFRVQLGFPDFKAFALMCARIEYPENAVPKPLEAFLAAETFTSIGEFYDAVRDAIVANDGQFHYDTANQRDEYLNIFKIANLGAAKKAIQLIQHQGEGGDKYPYNAEGKLSHFYTFGQLYYRQKYKFDPATQTGDWTGGQITIPDNLIYNMTPVPLGGYNNPPQEVLDFDQAFTGVLKSLESAWSGGGGAALDDAVGAMPDLTDKAITILKKKLPRPGTPGIYGPQFKIV